MFRRREQSEHGRQRKDNGNAAAADAGEIDKSKTYIVGMDDTFAPMGFRDEKGNLVGFDVDLANKVAEKSVSKWNAKPSIGP